MNASGIILWSTYVGGTNYGHGYGITIEPNGDFVYITGQSYANDISAVLNPGWGYGAFVSKLRTSNGNIEWTRFLTKNYGHGTRGNALCMLGSYLYVTGSSHYTELLGAENDYAGGTEDAFIAKLTTDGTVVKSAWFGGSRRDYGNDIFVDDQGNIYLAGDIFFGYNTTDYDLPNEKNKWRGSDSDGFVCKLNSAFQVQWSLYIGGSRGDGCSSIIGDNQGNLWISGASNSVDHEGEIIEPSKGQETVFDGFLTKIDIDDHKVDWTSFAGYWGGYVSQPKLTSCRKIITLSKDSPSGCGIQMFDADLGYHQWFHSEGDFLPHYYPDIFNDICVDDAMNIYICGYAGPESNFFPNRNNAHSSKGYDGFVVKTSPKGYFYHFNQLNTELPSGWISSTPDAWSVKAGKLVYEPQGDWLWHAYLDQNFFNYNAQVQCTRTKGDILTYGLVFKDDPNSNTRYYFNIVSDGSYYVDMDDGQSWQTLIGMTSTPYIKKDINQCNVLKIAVRDSVIKFYCNGGYLNEIKIKNLFTGRVGVFVIDFDSDLGVVEFDNFYVGSYTYIVTNVAQNQVHQSIPVEFNLFQNYPNPFNPTTTIRYTIPKKSKVTIKIYNLLGEEVKTLADIVQQGGTYTLHWNGMAEEGLLCPSGLYIYSIKAGNFIDTKKLMLIR